MPSIADRVCWLGSANYEAARCSPQFNRFVPGRYPSGIFTAESVEDCVAAIGLARDRGLVVSVRAGGHSWGCWGIRDGTLLVDVGAMKELMLRDDHVAVVGPGVRGGTELMPFLAERGRSFPGGHCPTVAVSGYLLNGGQGWNSRVWGWACQSVIALDVVTADGEVVHATETENPELLWAARGAGPGYFGIVVGWYLRTYPKPRWPAQSTVVWAMEHLDDVLRWAHDVLPVCDPACEPAFFSTWGPSLPWPIEPGGDGHVLMLHATAMVDSSEEAECAFAPLRACPILDRAAYAEFAQPTSVATEYAELQLQMPDGFRYAADCLWTDAGPDDVLPLLRPAFTDLPTERSFTLWNGWHPPERPDMAFSLEGNVYLASYAIWDDPALDDTCRDFVISTFRRLQPIGRGAYVGDANPVGRPDRFMAPANFDRLQQIRARHDPGGLFAAWAVAPGAVTNQRGS